MTAKAKQIQPLSGVKILEFATLLPGPFAGLMLAAAGAEVMKVERPEGDELRGYVPKAGEDSLCFALLNRGKRSIAIDLKAPGSIDRLRPLIREADVVIEQFRPGVMARLGLGYDALRAINPRIILCSITGFGQTGPRARIAGHDLNYQAEAGLLSLTCDRDGAPVLPATLVGDIGAGSLPAVLNILLALRQRDLTGEGAWLDIGITGNLLTFPYSYLGYGLALDQWPEPGRDRLTGASPRYQLYRTRDGRYLAAAPIEQRFWDRFCDALDLAEALRDDAADPEATRRAIGDIIARQDADHWIALFSGMDVCVTLVKTMQEAASDPDTRALSPLARQVDTPEGAVPGLYLPVCAQFLGAAGIGAHPALGEDQAALDRSRPALRAIRRGMRAAHTG